MGADNVVETNWRGVDEHTSPLLYVQGAVLISCVRWSETPYRLSENNDALRAAVNDLLRGLIWAYVWRRQRMRNQTKDQTKEEETEGICPVK